VIAKAVLRGRSMTLSDTKQHQILNDLYVEACGDLLSAYGLTVDIQEQGTGTDARRKDSYISILGATGEAIRLSSMLKIDQDLVVSMHPLGCADISLGDLEDWCRELNNQLVGRVKNKLLGYGHALIVGLPLLITGTDVSPVAAPDSEVHEYSVHSAKVQITLTLGTLVTADLELREVEPADGDAVLVEGAIALF
jgi:hypothetical protein